MHFGKILRIASTGSLIGVIRRPRPASPLAYVYQEPLFRGLVRALVAFNVGRDNGHVGTLSWAREGEPSLGIIRGEVCL